MLRRLGPDVAADDAALDAIADELGDLPLALHLVGSFLQRYCGSDAGQPAAYLAALKEQKIAHASMTGRGSQPSPTGHELNVAATFELSYQRLEAAGDTNRWARALLARAAHFLPGEPVPRGLLLATLPDVDELDREDALRLLLEVGLSDAEGNERVTLHRLVAHFAAERTADEQAQADVEETVLSASSEINRSGFPQRLLDWQSHLRHITARALKREDERAARLANELGYHLMDLGRYVEAEPLYGRALEIREAELGARHPDTAQSLNNLALLYQSQGRYAEAEPLYERALETLRAVLGDDYPSTQTVAGNLAYLRERMQE